MDKLEMQIKKTERLQREYKDLNERYDELLAELSEPQTELTALMERLSDIEKEWAETLNDIKLYRDEYKKLIGEMKDFQKKARKGKV